MKKRWLAVLLTLIALTLTACPEKNTPGVWDSSAWDSTANWQ